MPASLPPVPPVQAIVVRPRALAASTPFNTLGELPLVLIAIGHISTLPVCANLTGEQLLEAVVVGDAGDGGNIRGEGNGRQRGTFALIAADKLGGDVRGIGGAAAVAEEQDFMSGLKRAADELRDLHDSVGMVPREAPLDLGAVVEGLDGKFFHRPEL
jgi:hypothetical protein